MLMTLPNRGGTEPFFCLPPFPPPCTTSFMTWHLFKSELWPAPSASQCILPSLPTPKKNNKALQINFSGNLEENMMREKIKKPPNIRHSRTPTLPPLPFHNIFLWCLHFSKVTSEAFPSWLLKQNTPETPAPRST